MRFVKWILTALGLNILKGRAWATIGAAVAAAFVGAYTWGSVNAKLDCAADNARAEIKTQRQFTGNVKEASDAAMDSAILEANRKEYFRDALEEIRFKYGDEYVEDICGNFFDDDDLRLFNEGSKAEDTERLRP